MKEMQELSASTMAFINCGVVLRMKLADVTRWGSVKSACESRGGKGGMSLVDVNTEKLFSSPNNLLLKQNAVSPPFTSSPLSILSHLVVPANFILNSTLQFMKATVIAKHSCFS